MTDDQPTPNPAAQPGPMEAPEEHLAGLGVKFMAALEAHRRADVDTAKELLEQVLKAEPRLAEPRLELGRLHLDAGRLPEAELETREALRILLAGGQWIEDLSEEVMQSTAHGQLAEILRQKADTDEVIFGDPEVFKQLLAEAKQHFDKASQLDPSNDHAEYHAFFIGLDEDGQLDEDALESGAEPEA
ncbi:MAG: hypothetical protein H6740_27800 [Alphaproteobacteria bacterium]|nr:hypothetical protein [Alphaproteobacteria bacterium]